MTETTLPVVLSDADRRRLERLTRRKAKADAEWRDAIREIVDRGASLREVGDAADISHTAVKFIAHGRPTK